MEKKKLEQIVLIVLIPLFLLSLLYMRLKKGLVPGEGYEETGLEEKFTEDELIDKIPKPAAIPDVRYEGGTRDPFKNLLNIYLHKLELKKIRKQGAKRRGGKKVISLPGLDVKGLIWGGDMPQAIINNKVVRIGDSIGDIKVIGIEKKGITVMYRGETTFVPKK